MRRLHLQDGNGERQLVFKAHETVGGLKHLSCWATRMLLRRSRDYYVGNFEQYGAVKCTAATDFDGEPNYCNVCGFRRVVVNAGSEWEIEMCSAAPPLPLTDPRFLAWMRSGTRDKLPTSCV
jgi:hypothetical protein